MTKTSKFLLLLACFVSALSGCGGGGGSGDGSSYDLAGDAALIGFWSADVTSLPVITADLDANGDYAGTFGNGCAVTGKWYTSGAKLRFGISGINNGGLCSAYDISAGTSIKVTYSFTGVDEIYIEESDGDWGYYVRD